MKVKLDKNVHDIRWQKILFGGHVVSEDMFIQELKNSIFHVNIDWIEAMVFLTSTTNKNLSIEISFVYYVMHCIPVGFLSVPQYKLSVLMGRFLLCIR